MCHSIQKNPSAIIFHTAYGGEFCEEDFNGCSEIECFEGVECLDVPAPGVGALCGVCPGGYTGDGEKCFGKNLIASCVLAIDYCWLLVPVMNCRH